VILQKGATLKLEARGKEATAGERKLFGQVSGVEEGGDGDFWMRPGPATLVTSRLSPGAHTARMVELDSAGTVWFSDVIAFSASVGLTNEFELELRPGVTLRGRLDEMIPRPIKNGRVVAQVWPQGCKPQDSPPQWHAWTNTGEDGSFTIGSLPAGELEVVAMCEGFVSTNGPGQHQMRYPQKHTLGTNDLSITIGMEPTARLEVTATDAKGKPVKDLKIVTWPNVRYGEWAAVILMGDCYNTTDMLLPGPRKKVWWAEQPLDFCGITDESGVAILPNLPADVKELAVEDERFALPPVKTGWGESRRQAMIALTAGKTNSVSIQVEPRNKSPIRHY
jgi:hypothetical protein